jgi:16S rRNA G966 N2-methylase RsmD
MNIKHIQQSPQNQINDYNVYNAYNDYNDYNGYGYNNYNGYNGYNSYNKYNGYNKNSLYHNFKNNNYRNILSLKKLIFPPIAHDKIGQLMIDDESIKFITFASSAQEITNIIMNNLLDFPCPDTNDLDKWKLKSLDKKMKYLVITEMTAGVGGNVLNFANYFKYVNAIEIDNLRYNYLNKNIKLYGYNNVNCYNADSLNLLMEKDDIAQDIVFFDPPWGGKNYKLFSALRLKFGMYSIENICKILFQRSRNKMIIMKLPNNYDFDHMSKELKEFRFSKISLDRMTIVILKNYQTVNE